MKFLKASTLAVAGTALAQEDPIFRESSTSSAMEEIMVMKESHRAAKIAAGFFDEDRYEALAATRCVNGKAGEFSCSNIDLLAFLSHQQMGSTTRAGNDIWGWTSSTGREFALVGQSDGTAFVEILAGGSLKYVGRLPTQTSSSSWRDIKVIGNYAYIGSEASRHGLQVFDLTKLLSLTGSTPKTFSTSRDLTALHSGFSNSHNIVANAATNMIYAVGSNQCRGGLYMLDVSTPSSPSFSGCVSANGYTHDAQCIVYPSDGADAAFAGHEICFNFDESTLHVVDVTDKANPVSLSTTRYQGFAYTHQGWLADPQARFLLLDDELDELRGTSGTDRTTTYVFDMADLTAPKYVGKWLAPVVSIDHNQYVIDGKSYQSNYMSGLRIVDVSSLPSDPTGGSVKELAFFDVAPEDDDNPSIEFGGAWSVYPYFKSGTLVVNSIERGVFALKYTG